MDLGLEGRRAVVTGASKGIGLAVARRLLAEGVAVVAGSAALQRSWMSCVKKMALSTSEWISRRTRDHCNS